MLKQTCLATAALLGAGAVANGILMLLSPAGWYFAVPGVTTTGPFNQHFLRDIGIIFLFIGGAFLGGIVRPQARLILWGGATLWLCCHALFHLWEVAVGICAPADLVRDFPAVSLPAILGAAITLWAASARQGAPSPAAVATSR